MTDHTSPPGPGAEKLMVSSLTLGTEVDDTFIIASAQQGQARNGPYWRIEFRDASGSIAGKIWSPQSQAYPDLSAGMLVRIKGRVTSYRDQLELSVDVLRILSNEERSKVDLSLFMLSSPYSPDDMMSELLALASATLTHRPWRNLITSLLADGEIGMALRLAPAAKTMHHAYAGGLLEHTLSVTKLCMRLADHYPQLDRQALFAGAVCHDLGKLWELSSGLVVEYTQAGRLLGHIYLFLKRLGEYIERSGLEPDLAEHLEHMILSHHGSYEFGSPRLPATAEALALHYADILDAKLQQVDKALADIGDQGWTPYIPAMERSLFKAKHSPEKSAPQQDTQDIDRLIHEIDYDYPVPPPPPPPDHFSPLHERVRNGGLTNPPHKTPVKRTQDNPPLPEQENTAAQAQSSQPLSLFGPCSLPSKE